MTLIQRLALCWRILREKPGNLIAHALRELPKPGPDDNMQRRMNANLLELLLVFGTQGHSGFSAAWARGCLGTLLEFKPLGPLTGADSEWMHVGSHGGDLYQNMRCSRVFKLLQVGQPDEVYDIDGKVFREPSGACYTSRDSRTPVVFPYTPMTIYVDVPASVPDEERRA